MPGTRNPAAALAAHDEGAATDAESQAALGPFIERIQCLRPRRATTAFTDRALLRELASRLQPATDTPRTRTQRLAASDPGAATGSLRWCGASPLARKHAKWRERQRSKPKPANAV